MDQELKLGFHRLGRWFEEEVNLGLALVAAWVVTVWLIAIAAALSFSTVAIMIVAGIVVILLSRQWISELAKGWRRGRVRLERRRGSHGLNPR